MTDNLKWQLESDLSEMEEKRCNHAQKNGEFWHIHIFRWKLIPILSTEMWKKKCGKINLCTKLFTLSTKKGVNKLVYIGLTKEQTFCEL